MKINKEYNIKSLLSDETNWVKSNEEIASYVECSPVYVAMVRRKMEKNGEEPIVAKELDKITVPTSSSTLFRSEKEFEDHFCTKFGYRKRQGDTASGRFDVLTDNTVWELKLMVLRLRDAIAAYSQAYEYKEHLEVERVGVAAAQISRDCVEWLKSKGCEVYYEEIYDSPDDAKHTAKQEAESLRGEIYSQDPYLFEYDDKEMKVLRMLEIHPPLLRNPYNQIARVCEVSAPFVKKVIESKHNTQRIQEIRASERAFRMRQVTTEDLWYELNKRASSVPMEIREDIAKTVRDVWGLV